MLYSLRVRCLYFSVAFMENFVNSKWTESPRFNANQFWLASFFESGIAIKLNFVQATL